MRHLLGVLAMAAGLAAASPAMACNGPTGVGPGVGDRRTDFLIALALRESSGDKRCVNPDGYLGLFQMGAGALVDTKFYRFGPSGRNNSWDGTFTPRAQFVDVQSKQSFLDNAGAQELAIRLYHDLIWKWVVNSHLDRYLDQTVLGIRISRTGMVAGSHLVGYGKLKDFLTSGGAVVPADGNGTPITEYLTLFQAYDY